MPGAGFRVFLPLSAGLTDDALAGDALADVADASLVEWERSFLVDVCATAAGLVAFVVAVTSGRLLVCVV